MARNRLSPSRRREDIRAWWAEHLAAQRKSCQTQATYCRAQGLVPKYSTLWKGKLRDAEMAGPPRMVPVVVAPTTEPPVPAMLEDRSRRRSCHCACPWPTTCPRRLRSHRLPCRRWYASWLAFDAEAAVRYADLHGGGVAGHMRRSFSGLCAIITETLGANPIGGDRLFFCSGESAPTT